MYIVFAIPMLTVRPVSSLTLAFIFFAVSNGVPKMCSVPVMSMKASSIDICITVGEKSPNIFIIWLEISQYLL